MCIRHVYIRIYIYLTNWGQSHSWTCVYIYMSIYIYIYTCIRHIYIRIYIWTAEVRVPLDTGPLVYIYIYVSIHIYIYIYIRHIYMRVYIWPTEVRVTLHIWHRGFCRDLLQRELFSVAARLGYCCSKTVAVRLLLQRFEFMSLLQQMCQVECVGGRIMCACIRI